MAGNPPFAITPPLPLGLQAAKPLNLRCQPASLSMCSPQPHQLHRAGDGRVVRRRAQGNAPLSQQAAGSLTIHGATALGLPLAQNGRRGATNRAIGLVTAIEACQTVDGRGFYLLPRVAPKHVMTSGIQTQSKRCVAGYVSAICCSGAWRGMFWARLAQMLKPTRS
jgi:hypothetical protein